MIEEAEQEKFKMARGHRIDGFTIVELLVVIAIIGVLMALLLPAVQAARESGRRTVCMNNLYQLGMGVNRFDQDEGKVPNWANMLTNGNTVCWPVVLLPYIERNDLYETWTSPSGGDPARIAAFMCPSALPNASNTCPLAYAGNCGDGGALANSKYNGVLPSANVKYSLSDISDGDGLGTTLLFSEKCPNANQAYWGILVAGFSFQENGINSQAQLPAFGLWYDAAADEVGASVPKSQHPNGFNVAFCDGHTKFVNNSIAAATLIQLITSRNSRASTQFKLATPLDETSY